MAGTCGLSSCIAFKTAKKTHKTCENIHFVIVKDLGSLRYEFEVLVTDLNNIYWNYLSSPSQADGKHCVEAVLLVF